MTLQDFINKYLGQTKGYPDDSQYLGQCLSIVKLYIKEVFGIMPPPSGTNSAYGYWSNFPDPLDTVFERVLNTTDLIPEYGWIAIWKPWTGNTYGHIAIVDKDCTQTVLKNIAQNWTSKVFQRESQNYNNVIGFLKPKKVEETLNEDEKRALEALKRFQVDFSHGNLEGAVNAAIGAYKDLPSLQEKIKNMETQIAELSTQALTLSETNQSLTESLDAKQKEIADWQYKTDSANKIISEQLVKIQALEAQVNLYKKKYQEALISFPKNFSWRDILQLIMLKISNKA